MKIKTLIACFILACAASSCIQDEALNSEAAIDACTGDDVQQATIDSENFTIQLYVSKAAELANVNINFQLPAGATIAPPLHKAVIMRLALCTILKMKIQESSKLLRKIKLLNQLMKLHFGRLKCPTHIISRN